MTNTELRRQLQTLPIAVAAELLGKLFHHARFRPVRRAGCRCGSYSCDCARWEATFERNHGAAEREYYSGSTIRSAGSSLGGAVGQDLRGASLGTGVAVSPERDQWRAILHAEAEAGRERREAGQNQ